MSVCCCLPRSGGEGAGDRGHAHVTKHLTSVGCDHIMHKVEVEE